MLHVTHGLPATFPRYATRLGHQLVALAAWCARRLAAAVRSVRSMPADRWFWVVMVVLMVLYLLVLWTQPTGAGRGGR